MKKLSQLAALFIIFAIYSSSGQVGAKMPYSAGIYIGGNLNFHQPGNLSVTGPYNTAGQPGVFDEDKMQIGLAAGGVLNIPLGKYITISGRFGYNNFSGEFTSLHRNLPDTSMTNNLIFNVQYIEVTPAVQIHGLLPNTYLLGGLELGFPINPNYAFHQLDITPELTQDQTSRDLTGRVDLPEANTRTAIVVGAGYIAPVSGFLYLAPEVSYRIPLNKISNAANMSEWTVPQLRIGINLLFGFTL